MERRGWLVKLGVTAILLAALGWVATTIALSVSAAPEETEDLTTAWRQAGATRLGQSASVVVPPGQTLVAFIVGTDLRGIAGTSIGRCAGSVGGRPVRLSWPVHINPALTGILTDGEEVVAVAGWPNRGQTPVTVDITCGSGDSTVDHFVAVPTRTGTTVVNPRYHPWAWVVLGGAGAAAIGAAVLLRGRTP